MHDIIELNTYNKPIDSRFLGLSIDQLKVSIDDSIGISIDTLVEPSTDYSIGISIDAFSQALRAG